MYRKYLQRKPRSGKHKPSIILGAEEYCLGNCHKDVLAWYDHHGLRGGKKQIESEVTKHNDGNDWTIGQPTFMNTGFIMGPAAELAVFFKHILDTPYEVDDQYTTGVWVSKNLESIDLDLEEHFIRNKLVTLDKKKDEGKINGPGFLHFPGHRDDEKQANLLERYKEYMEL
jgi:hypothetical protein